ncbi:MAG: pilus assembly protein PilO [Gammaproteobacteria bacterium]|nr:MAG: pilus assembly protein PilO [Gammaproteobacteria bacterium]
MKWSEFKNLDPNDMGNWPPLAQGIVLLFLFVMIVAGGWYFDTRAQMEELAQAQAKESELLKTLERKQYKAANLEVLKKHMEVMKETFGDLLQSLPNRAEVAELLVEISQQGLGAGLEFELFKPTGEQPTDFYVELPIQIRVVGTYHQFGEFISGVADLARIVTIHDVKIRRRDEKSGKLVMELTAKTYRYLDEEEEAVKEAAK